MPARIFNVLMGVWLFASAFILPQGRVQFASTAMCGVLAALFAVFTNYDLRARYVSAAIGALVVVLALAIHPLGSATFWHNGVMGISIAAGAYADRAPLAERYPRELYGRLRA
jgi:hypothetical protein